MVQHNGIALEAQALPDAIHSDLKDQVILKAGQTFTSKTRYELVVEVKARTKVFKIKNTYCQVLKV